MQIRKDSTDRIAINSKQYPVASTSAPFQVSYDTANITISYDSKPISTSLWSDISFVDEGGANVAYTKSTFALTLAEVYVYLLTT